VFDVIGREKPVGALGEVHVEVIGPEIDHDFVELALGDGGAHHGELLKLSGQAARRLFPRSDGSIGSPIRRLLALAALALDLRVHVREIPAVQPQKGEPVLALGERSVVDLPRSELAVGPAHHAFGGHAVHFARARAVGESVERVQCRVVRGPDGGRARVPEGCHGHV